MMKLYSLVLVACAGLASAQMTQNSVTVTATRNVNLQPDQVVFLVSVATSLDATRDAVLSALQGSGITTGDFYGVKTFQVYNNDAQDYSNSLQWSFTLSSDIVDMKRTIGLLSAVQKSLAENGSGFVMSFSMQGTRVSQQRQLAQPCSLPDLMADARVQAQKLASATGASVGAVKAISGAQIQVNTGSSLFALFSPLPVCALTVSFQLTGGF